MICDQPPPDTLKIILENCLFYTFFPLLKMTLIFIIFWLS
ncbi:hypothetical Protein YC6258_05013 [Gynuella sunshinyii YC6258]|uniref:Uncharacterized protein n=1 Tax=Gynuella sunshinyii YC6258 TaxID=1445510 RepID=A0A0C5VCI1_9GAMM|nr:hypothetical Protein YC6258_05013 [Gynuella sunshinyii YC6258]